MRRIVLAAVILFGFGSQAFGQAAPDPATFCAPSKPGPGVFLYTIDLADKSTDGRRRFQPEDQVQINLINKNPFAYEYSIKIEEKAIPEPDLATFFKLFNTSPSAALLATVKAPGEASADGAAAKCLAALADIEDLRSRYNGLKKQAEEITALFVKVKEAADPEKQLAGNKPCPDLVTAARAIVKMVKDELDPASGQLGQKLAKFKVDLGKYQDALAQQTASPEALRISLQNIKTTDGKQACPKSLIDRAVEDYRALLQSLDPRNDKGLGQVATDFETAAKEAKATAEGIESILKDTQNFYEVRFVGDYDVPTLVTVKVDRKGKGKGQEFSPYLETKLRFGGRQRFALSAGAAFSPLDQKKYKAIKGFELEPDGSVRMVDGKPVQTRVVGVDEDARERVTPLIMLHARFAEGRGLISGFHFSFGFAGNTANNGVNLEYLVGPSISFAEERFFLTFGAYNGRTEKLQDGFHVGQALPTTITDLPVTRGRNWDWGFAVTVKFQP